ncbi:hypothetical protein [Arcobacter sp. YIC-310]
MNFHFNKSQNHNSTPDPFYTLSQFFVPGKVVSFISGESFDYVKESGENK